VLVALPASTAASAPCELGGCCRLTCLYNPLVSCLSKPIQTLNEELQLVTKKIQFKIKLLIVGLYPKGSPSRNSRRHWARPRPKRGFGNSFQPAIDAPRLEPH